MRFADLPIQRKLLGSVLLAVTVAAVVLVLSITLYETTTFRPRFVTGARADARMLADLLVPALEFSDDRTAAAQLASLERRPEVSASAIFLVDGTLFASRHRVAAARFDRPPAASAPPVAVVGRVVTVVERIEGVNGELGLLCMRIDLPTVARRFADHGIFVLASVVSLGVLAVLLSYVLRRAVSGPVETLVEAARVVSEKKDYALRVPVTGRDEFGRLAEAFNEMLQAIGTRDAARHRHEMRLARYNSGLVELAQVEMTAPDDPERRLRLILSILCRVHRVRRVGFWVLDEGGTQLRCSAGYDREEDRHFSGDLLRVEEAPTYFAALRSETVLAISETATDPIVAELRPGYLEPEGITSMLDLPVHRNGRLIGVLCHEHTGPARRWESQEINFASAVSDRVVFVLESEDLRAAQLALQDSEARYREMVEAAPDAIFTIDRHGRVREPNSALGRLTGWPEQRWREINWEEALVAEDRVTAAAAFAEVTFTGAPKVVTIRFVRPTGDPVALECFLAPRRQTAGPGAVLCVGRDQTERLGALAARARLEEQLRHAQKMEAVGTLAGGIAHDFNNILTALLGNLELIGLELPARHEARPFLQNTLQATHRAKDLVRQILTFSRRQESRRRPVRLADTVGEALGLLRASLPASIEIVSRNNPATPPILADETQIHQVVMNLATNAFHAMETTGGRLTVEVGMGAVGEPDRVRHPQLSAGEFVVLAVEDTGCGMDEATLGRLFEPFFTTKAQGRGTGLGMAVVHGILQTHEARVAVESAVGRGTSFRIYFPPWREAAVVAPAPGRVAVGASRSGLVLLVDDERPVLQVADLLLRRQGFTVRGFLDPRDAIREFEERPAAFDLIVTDLTMPYLGGLDLVRRVRTRRPDLPALIMTGYGGDHDARTFSAAGVCGPLQKPFTADAFNEAVALALRGLGLGGEAT